MAQRGFSYRVYATQADGGIREDGRIGIDMQGGDFTVAEIHCMIDELKSAARKATGPGLKAVAVGELRSGACRFD